MTPVQGSEGDAPIWLLGGRGDVGRRLATLLATAGSRPVVLCGRDKDAAAMVARQIGLAVTTVGIDSSDPDLARKVPTGATLVNLTEATDPAFAAHCVATGGLFIESSASPGYVDRVIAATSASRSGLAVVNAGLMPGLSNICARHLRNSRADLVGIDIVIEMGLGRHHGGDASRWTIGSLGTRYDTMIDGHRRTLPAGHLRRKVRFAGDSGERLAPGFPFSDQRAIADLGIPTARSFLALDPPWVMRLMDLALRVGLGRAIARRSRQFQWLLDRLPVVGGIGTRLVVEARGTRPSDISRIEVHTGDQADVTAVMLHETLLAGQRSRWKGTIGSDRLTGLEDALAAIRQHLPETHVFQAGYQCDL